MITHQRRLEAYLDSRLPPDFAASVWINDRFIGSVQTEDDHANHLFTFPEGALVVGQDNVLTVLHDNQGLEEDDNDQMDNEKSPRGIAGFALEGGKFTTWRVQGKLGGYTRLISPSAVSDLRC